MKKGKHKGKTGKVFFYRTEGDGGRITLIVDGSYIYVDKDDIDFKFDSISIVVMMEEEERAAFQQRVKEIKESGYLS